MGFIRDSFGRVCVESRRESFILHVDHGGAPGPSPEFLTADLDDVIAALSDYRASLPNAGRAAATPDPPDDDKRVRVTCFDPVTGESETQPLDPDNYILTLGERCEITACQVYANGTVQLTIKRGAT